MPIRLICVCGRAMALPEKYAGEHVQCPQCKAMLRIPSREEDLQLTRWFCVCGLRLKARLRSAGRKISCPRCSATITVPPMDDHTTFIEERFVLDEGTRVVQLAGPLPPAGGSLASEAYPPESVQQKLELVPISTDEEVTALGPGETVPFAQIDAESAGKEQSTYAVEPLPVPVGGPAAVPKSTMGAPLSAARRVAAEKEEEESWAVDQDEGIQAENLTRYFNTPSGTEAARAAVTQVLNGYWLYIPYALLGGCMFNVSYLLLRASRHNASLGAAGLVLQTALSLFLWAAFVGCIKDGVFERSIGIERMLYNAAKHFLRFSATALCMAPVGVGLAVAGSLAIAFLWQLGPWPVKLGAIVAAAVGGIFAFTLLFTPPIVAVLEELNPIVALKRGLRFGIKYALGLLTLTVVSVFVGGGVVGAVYLIWWLSRALLYVALQPAPWLYEALRQFFGSLGASAFMGQIVAAIMLLYLSNLDDEGRLQAIRRRLRGPAAVPARLYITIGFAAVALLALNYANSLYPHQDRSSEIEAEQTVKPEVFQEAGPELRTAPILAPERAGEN